MYAYVEGTIVYKAHTLLSTPLELEHLLQPIVVAEIRAVQCLGYISSAHQPQSSESS